MTTTEYHRHLTDEQSADYVIILIEFELKDSVDDPAPEFLRITSDDIETTSGLDANGVPKVYSPLGFSWTPPATGPGRTQFARISVDNLDRSIVEIIKASTVQPRVRVDSVLASAPDVVQRSFPNFDLGNIGWNDLTIEGTLVIPDDQDEPLSARAFTPATAPALFEAAK